MNQEDIASAAVAYFKDQLGGDHVSQDDSLLSHILIMISEEDNTLLNSFPSIEEVKKIIKEVDQNSTAGPDEFNAFFYQQCWDIITEDFFYCTS